MAITETKEKNFEADIESFLSQKLEVTPKAMPFMILLVPCSRKLLLSLSKKLNLKHGKSLNLLMEITPRRNL